MLQSMMQLEVVVTMSSGHDVSEYELDYSGLPPMFHHNNRTKIDENPRKIMIFVKIKIK